MSYGPCTASACAAVPAPADGSAAAYIVCFSSPGIGVNWPVSLSVAGLEPVRPSSRLAFSYAPPVVSGFMGSNPALTYSNCDGGGLQRAM